MTTASDHTLREVSAVALAAQPAEAATVLPGWAAPAIRGTRPAWPENIRRYAIRVGDGLGTSGWYGPCSAAVVTIIRDQFAPALAGWPIARWRVLADRAGMGRHRTGSHFRLAASAVELALWDLRSKVTKVEVTGLLGGRLRAAVPAYASALGIDIDHALAGDVARWIAAAGFWGQKWRLPGAARGDHPRRDIDRVLRLREAIGPTARLMIDAVGEWSPAYFQALAPGLEAADLTWIEEPPAGAARSRVVVAGGEHAYDPADQLALLTGGAVQVWQPDVAWHGGLAPAVAMTDIASTLGIPSFPHASSLPAALHLGTLFDDRAVPALEYHLTLDPRRHSVLRQPPVPVGGMLTGPVGPGLTSAYLTADHTQSICLVGDGDATRTAASTLL